MSDDNFEQVREVTRQLSESDKISILKRAEDGGIPVEKLFSAWLEASHVLNSNYSSKVVPAHIAARDSWYMEESLYLVQPAVDSDESSILPTIDQTTYFDKWLEALKEAKTGAKFVVEWYDTHRRGHHTDHYCKLTSGDWEVGIIFLEDQYRGVPLDNERAWKLTARKLGVPYNDVFCRAMAVVSSRYFGGDTGNNE